MKHRVDRRLLFWIVTLLISSAAVVGVVNAQGTVVPTVPTPNPATITSIATPDAAAASIASAATDAAQSISGTAQGLWAQLAQVPHSDLARVLLILGGVVLLMVAHGLSVALLFLLATSIHHRTHTFAMEDMGGLAQKAPVLAAFFVAATLASIGLPGFANFWGELTIFVALWKFSPLITALAVAGVVISAVYGLRSAAKVFFGSPTEAFTVCATPRSR